MACPEDLYAAVTWIRGEVSQSPAHIITERIQLIVDFARGRLSRMNDERRNRKRIAFQQNGFHFQQDDFFSQKSEETQEWITGNFLTSSRGPQRPGQWPTNSPDLNTLDYSTWGILKSIACVHPIRWSKY
ncbi:hypothetical protein ANCDUO_02564 [Ancylostoma duodenale]|uniref:Uncharacterized protein n=1 Tax=Ancylostoma duodenale TaxID=51022 RepID=A0A0C2H021_9BILA|nr:hypothetical protein ANCDUO_02564 [Ancylostoma duodenale]